jgi:hypothetical protein
MDVTLGPWTADMSVAETQRKPLAEAMGNEAWNTVKNAAGFTPKEAPQGKPAKSGFTISGKLTNVLKDGGSIRVMSKFTLWVDGTFSNVAPLDGQGSAQDGATAEDVLRAITESRVKKLLEAVKTGRATKAR